MVGHEAIWGAPRRVASNNSFFFKQHSSHIQRSSPHFYTANLLPYIFASASCLFLYQLLLKWRKLFLILFKICKVLPTTSSKGHFPDHIQRSNAERPRSPRPISDVKPDHLRSRLERHPASLENNLPSPRAPERYLVHFIFFRELILSFMRPLKSPKMVRQRRDYRQSFKKDLCF